jgi:hypothetical protein
MSTTMTKRKQAIDGLAVTANLAMAIDDLRELERRLPRAERGKVENLRIGLEMAHRDVLAIVRRANAGVTP